MRVGVLGGTFDPIHLGHTYIAGKIRLAFNLDKVVFMVSKYPPHKRGKDISSAFHRYAMTILELMNEDSFHASTFELSKNRPSYTIDTMEELNACYPDDQFCFIAGTDSLQELSMWHEYAKLLRGHCLVFVQRPGAEVVLDNLEILADLKKSICEVETATDLEIRAGRSYCMSLCAPAVSSTEIRQVIASGRNPSQELISPAVYQYIRKYRLYE
ncbi:MAG: nicotinate-nucleotide adenylyltransferase [bacterium]